MFIEIDKKSGFCFGVVKAIDAAHSGLNDKKPLYCLGDIVHNSQEVERLKRMGLKVITRKEMGKMYNVKVMIRAHGEPPETYELAKRNNIELIDATCPIVLKLQQRVKKGSDEMQQVGGYTFILGKAGHAEVLGLMGQTGGSARVIQGIDDLEDIDFTKPSRLYAQTTEDPEKLKNISEYITSRYRDLGVEPDLMFKVHDTTCGQVSNRAKEIKEFARRNDVIIFVSDPKSSNGRQLYNVSKSNNNRSYFVTGPQDIDYEWIKGAQRVGVCGATSTPQWVMEEVKAKIENLKEIS